jgi:hypothetical protein
MRLASLSSWVTLGAAAAFTCASASGCGGGAPAPPSSPAPSVASVSSAASAGSRVATRARAPFVLAIVVDQLSAWVAASRWPELPKDGGFARLMREGTWAKNVRYPYAVTDTAPGHTSLHTGKVPAESGVTGNELPNGAGDRFSILRDDTTRLLAAGGVRDSAGSSASLLRVDTVADKLRAAHPEAFVVSVSVKDRAAILPAGKHPTHVLWFDAAQDAFVTSTAFASTYPTWAADIGGASAVAAARKAPWELTDASWVAAHAAGPDAQPGEGDLDGLGVTFPHVGRTAAAFRGMPASDQMILDLALAAMNAEYDPSKPTMLLLSMSASDVIGHVFGPDSWEAWDHLRKLDARLAVLLATLERRLGAFPVVLAADHGNLSMPEIDPARAGVKCGPGAAPDPYARPCKAGVRVEQSVLHKELVAAAKKALGEGTWIAGIADPYLFLTPAARALPKERRARLDDAVARTFANHKDGVAEIFDTRALAERCPRVLATAKGSPERAKVGEDVVTLVCRSWAPVPASGDVYIVLRAGSIFDPEIVFGKGASHGAPYLFDRTVPLLVRGLGIEAGKIIDAPVDFSVFSALEAAFVGLDGRPAGEILSAHTAR